MAASMADFIFPPPPTPGVPTTDGRLFPVRRILCVGRNYAAHRREMGADERTPPFFFAKPADAIAPDGAELPYPSATAELHHEVELVAALGRAGAGLGTDEALDLVFGYAVGVDLTRRDLQNGAKARAEPWEAAKAFDASAPIGAIRPWRGSPPQGRIRLSVDGQIRQDAVIADMIWSVAEIVSEASRLWRLEPGDLIFTGTPEGVGPLRPGQSVSCAIEAVGDLRFSIAA